MLYCVMMNFRIGFEHCRKQFVSDELGN